ncbi:MAG: hypothetical protein ACI8QY_001189 [bacterium]|jgi:hypothetical protein
MNTLKTSAEYCMHQLELIGFSVKKANNIILYIEAERHLKGLYTSMTSVLLNEQELHPDTPNSACFYYETAHFNLKFALQIMNKKALNSENRCRIIGQIVNAYRHLKKCLKCYT